MYCEPLPVIHEPAERPVGFIAPNLSPEGLELVPTALADGVYGLVANQIPKDNNGLIIGERAALVVDSGITPGMGRYISNLADSLSDAPVRYLANTTYHGDHTFGNVAFGPEVAIVSSRINKSAMTDLEEEKAFRGESMYGHPGMAEVDTWRKPDMTFDRFCEIDLGNRVVHLWHFGPGNGSGDTIVHVPDAKVAWVGNQLRHAGIPPMLLAGDPVAYGRTVRALRSTLALETIVPGHGPLTDATPSITWMTNYLERITTTVRDGRDAGGDVLELLDQLPLIDPLRLSSDDPFAERFDELMQSLHRLNVLLTYRWLQKIDH